MESTGGLQPIDTAHLIVHPGFWMGPDVEHPPEHMLGAYRDYFCGLLEVANLVRPNDVALFFSGLYEPAQQSRTEGKKDRKFLGQAFDELTKADPRTISDHAIGFHPDGLLHKLRAQIGGRTLTVGDSAYDENGQLKKRYLARRLAALGKAVEPHKTRCRVYGEGFYACVLDHALGFHTAFDLEQQAEIVLQHTDFVVDHLEEKSTLSFEDYLRVNLQKEDLLWIRRVTKIPVELERIRWILPKEKNR